MNHGGKNHPHSSGGKRQGSHASLGGHAGSVHPRQEP